MTVSKIIKTEFTDFKLKRKQIELDVCKKLIHYYGFVSDPTLTPCYNAYICMGNLPTFDYWNRPTNKAFHNLTSSLTPLPNLRSLLGLSLGFIPTPFHPTSFSNLLLDKTAGFPHLEQSLRLKYFPYLKQRIKIIRCVCVQLV